MWTWGYGYAGRLGHGNSTTQYAPVQVGADTDWTWVSAGAEHTLAVKSDGSLWSWGEGHRGRLGHGDTLDQNLPTRVGTDADWVWVSAGAQESFAMKADGTLWSWGYGAYYGHLGQGDTLDYHVPTQVLGAAPGTLVEASKSGYFAMGVTVSRVPEPLQIPQLLPELSAEISSANAVEVLGNTVSLNATITGATYGISQVEFFLDGESLGAATTPPFQLDWVATAGFHTIDVVVTDQLGETSTSEPIEIAVSADLDTTFSGTANQAYSWGKGYYRATGQGIGGNLVVPTQIGSESEWTWLAAGGDHGLGVKFDGTLWSWGEGQHGRLGHGDELDAASPKQVGTTNDWALVAAGHYHTAALKWDGSLWTWGRNHKYQLGHGYNTSNFLTPDYVNTDRDWAWVAAGSAHTLALKENGTLWAWGWGLSGQLGTGGTTDKPYPTQITTDTDWAWIDAGESHSVALKEDGTLWTWGQGAYGRLGHGDTARRYEPTQVGTDSDWARVSAGWGFNLALKADGSLWSWGYGLGGALGHGDTQDLLVPTRVGTDMDWVWISAGNRYSFALKADGSLWSWGGGAAGALGLGDTLDYHVPTQVVSAPPGLLVDASDYGYFALGRTVYKTPDALEPPPAQMYPQLLINAVPQGGTHLEDVELALTGAIITSTAPIARVDFLADGVVFDSDADAPYYSSWTVLEGVHELTAVAVDDLGATGTAEPITITGLVNTAPAISDLVPADQSTNINGTVITLGATATDAENNVASVAFYVDGVLHDEVSGYPYESTWQLTPGPHQIYARVTDTRQAFTETPVHTITGVSNTAPTVTLTAPTVPTSVEENDLVTMEATAADIDGDLESVTFYLNGYALATIETAPFTYTWTATPGSYAVTALARDVWGWEGQSEAVSLTVTNALPPPPAPPVVTSAWTPQDIYLGQEQTYTWSSSGASECFGGKWNTEEEMEAARTSKPRALSGSIGPETPGAVGNYTAQLTCLGENDTITISYAPRTVSDPPPPTLETSWEPPIVAEGTEQTYRWESQHAKSCSNSLHPEVDKGTSGVEYATCPIGIYEATLTCEGWDGSSVVSRAPREVIETPTVTAYWEPEIVQEGIPQTYYWSSTNMTKCVNGQGVDLGTSGDSEQTSPAGTYTAVLNCTGRDGLVYTDISPREVLGEGTPPVATGVKLAPGPAANPGAGDSAVSDAVGAINGSFSVGPAGNATYDIPFVTAAGVAGVAPQIGLRYDSSAGNGIAGKGTSLTGLSSISRCRQTLHHDNNVEPITFSAADRFCLDGQRLVRLGSGPLADGAEFRTAIDSYRRITAHGTGTSSGNPDYFTVTAKDGSTTYYGLYDSNDARHKLYEPGSFVVSDKVISWKVVRFQDSVGNQIRYEYHAERNRLEKILFAYVGGTAGASLVFSYDTDVNDRDDPVYAYIGGYRSVLRDRLSGVTSLNGTQVVRQYDLTYPAVTPGGYSRLSSIVEKAGGVSLKPTQFEWTEESVANAGFEDRDLLPIDAAIGGNYIDSQPADLNGDGYMDLLWIGQQSSGEVELHASLYEGAQFVLADCPPSLCRIELNDNAQKTWRVVDYNGDGSHDVAYVDKSGNLKIVLTRLGRTAANFTWAHEFDTGINLGVKTKHAIAFADLDADGLADVIYEPKNQSAEVRFMRRNPTPENCATGWPADLPCAYELDTVPYDIELLRGSGTPTSPTGVIDKNFVVADFNGDGRSDLVISKEQMCEVPNGDLCQAGAAEYHAFRTLAKNPGQPLQMEAYLETEIGDASTGKPEKMRAADFNGDGLTDILYESSATASNWRYQVNNGSSFEDSLPLDTLTVNEEGSLQFADVNRDGYTDIVITANSGGDAGTAALHVFYWSAAANAFGTRQTLESGISANAERKHKLFDANGDGRVDWIDIDRDSNKDDIWLTHGKGVYLPHDKIRRIDNGLGREHTIDYLSTRHRWQADFYTRDNDAHEAYWTLSAGEVGLEDGSIPAETRPPTFDIHPSMYLVRGVCTSSPSINEQTAIADTGDCATEGAHTDVSRQTYDYSGAKLQGMGRGFLGFRKVEVQDMHSGVRTVTEYRQDYPFTGRPRSTERVQNSTGTLLNRSTSVHGFADNAGLDDRIHNLYLRETVEESFDPDSAGQALGRVVMENHDGTTPGWDSWGNLTYTRTEHYNGADVTPFATVSTQNSFGNADEQEKGRLRQATVTHDRSGETPVTRVSNFNYYASGDLAGLLESESVSGTNEHGTTTLATTRHYYDSFGNKARVERTGDGGIVGTVQTREQRWEYDDGRYLAREYTSMGVASVLTREVLARDPVFGLPTRERDLNGVETESVYGALGRLFYQYTNTGAWQRTVYSTSSAECPSGTAYAVTVSQAGGGSALACFDALGREVRTGTWAFGGGYDVVDIVYDERGRVRAQSTPYQGNATGNTLTAYDAYDRVDLITHPDGTTTDYAYAGLTVTTTNAKGQVRTETRNSKGELTAASDNGGTITYAYDAAGNLRATTVTTNTTVTTTMDYDAMGRKISMTDPDKGTWLYQYNDFGELVKQTNAKGEYTVLGYDSAGRRVSRTDSTAGGSPLATTAWIFDSYAGRSQAGALIRVIHNDDYSLNASYTEDLEYDAFGRVAWREVDITGLDPLRQNYTYDAYGRSFQVYGASNDYAGVEYAYNTNGYRSAVLDSAIVNGQQKTWYRVDSVDTRGNQTGLTLFTGDNPTTVTRSFDVQSNYLTDIDASSNLGIYQDLFMSHDSLGNVTGINDNRVGHNDSSTYGYDNLNRLTSETVNSVTRSFTYEDNGNIDTCDGVNYDYGACGAGPHGVSTVGTTSLCYDANGNMIDDGDRQLSYTIFDKPHTVTRGANNARFAYGPERGRFKQVAVVDGRTESTYYLLGMEVLHASDTGWEYRRNIDGVAQETIFRDNGQVITDIQGLFFLRNHLGSVDQVLNQDGFEVTEMSFNAWGQRRDADTLQDILNPTDNVLSYLTQATKRGFTGHEMLDEFGLIHMNGRVYDAKIGRFLSADPFVQFPTNTQSYNRYSYVLNNPLGYTDPSGYLSFKEAAGIVIGAAVSYVTAGAAAPWVAGWASVTAGSVTHGAIVGAMAGFVGGFSSGLVMTGSVEAAFTNGAYGALSGAAFGAIGMSNLDFGERVLAHGLAGGTLSHLRGGNFGQGFLTAGLTKAANVNEIVGIGADLDGMRVVVAAIVGGTISDITGGKFANGALTGAMAQILNGNEDARRQRLNELIAAAHAKLIALRKSVEGSSSWGANDLGIYVFENEGEFTLSTPFPADVKNGNFINPESNVWNSQSAVLDVDQANIAAVVINEVSGHWSSPEIQNAGRYLDWSKKIGGPVSVSINNNHRHWYRARWTFEGGKCMASGYKGAGSC